MPGSFQRSRATAKTLEDGRIILIYTQFTRYIFIFGFIFFTSFLFLSIFIHFENGKYFIVSAFSLFSILFLYLVLEAQVLKFTLFSNGIRYETLFKGRGFLRWSEIKTVRYSEASKWVKFVGEGGQVVRISMYLTNLPYFAALTLSRVPSARIEQDAQGVLTQCAAGDLPSLWG